MDYQRVVKELVESFGSWFEDEQKLLDGRMTAESVSLRQALFPDSG